jgi:hypothetical protein
MVHDNRAVPAQSFRVGLFASGFFTPPGLFASCHCTLQHFRFTAFWTHTYAGANHLPGLIVTLNNWKLVFVRLLTRIDIAHDNTHQVVTAQVNTHTIVTANEAAYISPVDPDSGYR